MSGKGVWSQIPRVKEPGQWPKPGMEHWTRKRSWLPLEGWRQGGCCVDELRRGKRAWISAPRFQVDNYDSHKLQTSSYTSVLFSDRAYGQTHALLRGMNKVTYHPSAFRDANQGPGSDILEQRTGHRHIK